MNSDPVGNKEPTILIAQSAVHVVVIALMHPIFKVIVAIKVVTVDRIVWDGAGQNKRGKESNVL